MVSNIQRWRRRQHEEAEKDLDNVPETLGFPDEEKMDNGDLRIFLRRQPDSYVAVGKFKSRHEGDFYVHDGTRGVWTAEHVTTRHDNIILAVARVYEIIETYNQRTTRA